MSQASEAKQEHSSDTIRDVAEEVAVGTQSTMSGQPPDKDHNVKRKDAARKAKSQCSAAYTSYSSCSFSASRAAAKARTKAEAARASAPFIH